MARLQKLYREKIAAELKEKFGYQSVMEVPRLTKITLNMGVGEAVADKKVLDNAVADLDCWSKARGGQGQEGYRWFQDPRRPGYRLHGDPARCSHVRIPGPLRDDRSASRA